MFLKENKLVQTLKPLGETNMAAFYDFNVDAYYVLRCFKVCTSLVVSKNLFPAENSDPVEEPRDFLRCCLMRN